jgi:hypothetical protein
VSAPTDVRTAIQALALVVAGRGDHNNACAALLILRANHAAGSALVDAARAVEYASEHHHTGCSPRAKRMPPELRDAIGNLRAALGAFTAVQS